MKKHFLTLLLSTLLLIANSQEVKLIINGVEHRGVKVDGSMVDFSSANSTLITTVELKKIVADLKFYRTLAHEDSIKISALNNIINSFEKLKKSGDTLINHQKVMITTADSLFNGYKSLYHDLKRLSNINTFSIIPGVGLVNIPDISPSVNLVFNVGFEYNKVNLNALLGKKYQGLTVGYRIGF